MKQKLVGLDDCYGMTFMMMMFYATVHSKNVSWPRREYKMHIQMYKHRKNVNTITTILLSTGTATSD